MDRRSFIKMSATVAIAGGIGAKVPAFAESSAGKGALMKTAFSTGGTGTGASGNLKVRFLGTGAADWNGTDSRGECRRLTSILLDDAVLVDFTPSNADMLLQGCRPEVIFYTHSHGDHYNPAAALRAGVKKAYVSRTWFERALDDFKKAASETDSQMPVLLPLETGEEVSEKGITFVPLPANHATGDPGEQTLLFLIKKDSTRLLYATDTGGIPANAARLAGIDVHKKGEGITALIMEATIGLDQYDDYRLFTHSSVNTVAQTVAVLEKTGRYTAEEGQKVYLTHLARTLHGTQAQLDATLPYPLKAAYDGLEVYF